MRRFHNQPAQGYITTPTLPYRWINRWIPPQGFVGGSSGGGDMQFENGITMLFESGTIMEYE